MGALDDTALQALGQCNILVEAATLGIIGIRRSHTMGTKALGVCFRVRGQAASLATGHKHEVRTDTILLKQFGFFRVFAGMFRTKQVRGIIGTKRQDMCTTWVHLGESLYSSPLHFVEELLQNVDDCRYGIGVVPTFCAHINRCNATFCHNRTLHLIIKDNLQDT